MLNLIRKRKLTIYLKQLQMRAFINLGQKIRTSLEVRIKIFHFMKD